MWRCRWDAVVARAGDEWETMQYVVEGCCFIGRKKRKSDEAVNSRPLSSTSWHDGMGKARAPTAALPQSCWPPQRQEHSEAAPRHVSRAVRLDASATVVQELL